MIRRLAVHAVTRGGVALGARVAGALGAELFAAAPVAGAAPGARAFPLPMRDALAGSFRAYDGHVLVLAVGAAVRLVAPLLASKRTDPAVVCLDEAGRFAVALLSGHAGGANDLARAVADAVGATPVVTTASDALGTLQVDLLGRALGWTLEDPAGQATRAAAAVVNGEPVLVLDEAGGGWWPEGRPLPGNVVVARTRHELDAARTRDELDAARTRDELDAARSRHEPAAAPSSDGVDPARWAAVVAITDRDDPGDDLLARAVRWRPRSLVVGVGCDRGARPAAVEAAVAEVLASHRLAVASIAAVATIDLKRDEEGIVELAARRGRPLRLFGAAELDAVDGIETPSATVRRRVGTRSVAEAAALLAAGARRLLVAKQVRRDGPGGRSVTVAVARVPREDG